MNLAVNPWWMFIWVVLLLWISVASNESKFMNNKNIFIDLFVVLFWVFVGWFLNLIFELIQMELGIQFQNPLVIK